MVRLVELEPRWAFSQAGRSGMGVTFDCPAHRAHRLAVWFTNPIDGGPALPVGPGGFRWARTGDTFETLTLAPSVDASINCECGRPKRRRPQDPDGLVICADTGPGHTPCWHGFITHGIVT